MIKKIKVISEKLKTIDKKIYIVGGFCREKIIGNSNYSGDIDLVTDAKPEEIKKVLRVIGEVGKKYGTCIIKEGGEIYEITTMRKDIGTINNRKPAKIEFTDSIEIDAKRRDFKCNAIYLDPVNNKIIDPLNGIKDIKSGIISFVGDIEERLEEDVLRILRFIRFKNKYNFNIEEKSYFKKIKKYTPLLKNISTERVKQELDKILLLKNNVEALEDLKQIGFLKLFLPEIDNQDKCLGNKWHLEGNVWIHTKMCIEEINKIIDREKIEENSTKLVLIWTVFLHDIGKAPTYSIGDDGEGHYHDHENIGAEIFKEKISKDLMFTKKQTEEIYFLIKQHIRIFLIPEMKKLKSRKLMMHKYFENLILISEADNKGRIPAKPDLQKEILNIYENFKVLIKSKKFLTGKDIIKKYPHLKGSKIGERLKDLNNQILIED